MCNSLEELSVITFVASLMHSCDNHFYLNHHDQGKILSLGVDRWGQKRQEGDMTILPCFK